MNDDNSIDTISAASPEEEEMPVVEVLAASGLVVLKWESEETAATSTSMYSHPPYSFHAVKADGDTPLLETFGTLLRCNGGILKIRETRYRIRAQQLEQQQLDASTREVVEYVRKQQREAETLVFSKVKSDAYREVTDDLGVKLTGAKWNQRPTDIPDVQGGFTWFKSKEDSQENRDGYMNYLGDKIHWPAGYAVADCNAYKDLLSVATLGGGKHKTSGNIDVVLAEEKDVENCTIRQNIRAGIELKKDTNAGSHEHQVVLQHLAASSLNPDESVLTVMTDLNKRWHFYWFGSQRGRLYKCIARTGSEAKFLLEHMFGTSDSIDATLFPTEFLGRATWREFFGKNLLTIRETPSKDSHGDNDDFPPDSRHSQERESRDPHSYGGNNESDKKDDSKEAGAHGEQVGGKTYGMDVANEIELLDFVDDEEEKRAIHLRFLSNHILPMMTYIPEQKRHGTQEKEYHELSAANLAFHNATT